MQNSRTDIYILYIWKCQKLLFWYYSSALKARPTVDSRLEIYIKKNVTENVLTGRWTRNEKLPARLLTLISTVVFAGLRRSRKPQWAPLLPRHPLHLPLSRQGPQSRRRRSWAPTMRSKRTLQTTAKVRTIHKQTDPHILKSSVPNHYFHFLRLSCRDQQWLFLFLLFCHSHFSLHPDGICSCVILDVSVTCSVVVTPAFQGCLIVAKNEQQCSFLQDAKGCAVCREVHFHYTA